MSAIPTYAAQVPEAGLKAALATSRPGLISEIAASGLKGRGGAGFPTSVKWNFAAAAQAERKFVICNADEGEPGTFKDRVILMEHPDLVFEGMTIAGKAIGAREGILFLRGEYTYLRGGLEHALARRREQGLLGPGILGSGLKVVGEQPGNWTNSVAMQVTENMLQANKKVDGLFSASDVMLDGTLQAIGDANRSGIKILSVDGSKKAVDLVEQGAIVGTMAQFPAKMGTIAVENLLAVLDGKKAASSIPKVIDSGTMVYDKTNLDEARKWAF